MRRVPDDEYKAIIDSAPRPELVEAFGEWGMECTYGKYKMIVPDHFVEDARAHIAAVSAEQKQNWLPDIQRTLERNMKRFDKLSANQKLHTAQAMIMWELLRN